MCILKVSLDAFNIWSVTVYNHFVLSLHVNSSTSIFIFIFYKKQNKIIREAVSAKIAITATTIKLKKERDNSNNNK